MTIVSSNSISNNHYFPPNNQQLQLHHQSSPLSSNFSTLEQDHQHPIQGGGGGGIERNQAQASGQNTTNPSNQQFNNYSYSYNQKRDLSVLNSPPHNLIQSRQPPCSCRDCMQITPTPSRRTAATAGSPFFPATGGSAMSVAPRYPAYPPPLTPLSLSQAAQSRSMPPSAVGGGGGVGGCSPMLPRRQSPGGYSLQGGNGAAVEPYSVYNFIGDSRDSFSGGGGGGHSMTNSNTGGSSYSQRPSYASAQSNTHFFTGKNSPRM